MSKVTEQDKALLKAEGHDSEGYHAVFDDLLENKLAELDPEWITEMKQLYKDSRCCRWYA